MIRSKINLRSLRVKLCLWYVFLSMISLGTLGAFSSLYLVHALASSRVQTMERREIRLVRYLEDEPKIFPKVQLADELKHFMLATSDNDILQVNDLTGGAVFLAVPNGDAIAWKGDASAQPRFQVVDRGGHRYRLLQQIISIHGQPYRVTMGGIVDEYYDILRMVESSYLIFLPLILVSAVAGGFMLSHRALEPVDRITRSAHTISIRDLSHRLPVPHTGDELQRLAETWNDLLERLETAVNHLRQVTGDLSHDLRTSITVILSTSQLALRRDRTKEEYRESLETILAESQSTATLLDDLLAASRSDASDQKIDWSPVDLSALVRESCDHVRARAQMRQQRLFLCVDDASWVWGDRSLLRRLVNILLDNALKYTGEGGRITASVHSADGCVDLEIRDTGVGIAANEVSNIFNRFHRGDASRNRDQGGNGLGLAIAKWIAEAHHSTIMVASSTPRGSIFSVSFPIGGEAIATDRLH